MKLAEQSIVIDRSAEEVFAFVTEPTNDPSWHTTVIEARRTSDGPVGLGTTFVGIYDSQKRTLTTPAHPTNFQPIKGDFTEFVPDQFVRIHVEFTSPPRGIGARILGPSFDLTFRIETLPRGVRLFRGGEVHPVPMMWPLMPLFARIGGSRNRYLLENLKRAVEARR